MSKQARMAGACQRAVAGAALVIAVGLIAGGCSSSSSQLEHPGWPGVAVPARPDG